MLLGKYSPVLSHFSHQLSHIEQHRDARAWGLLWEMGTGKTKPVVETAMNLYSRSEIDGLLVVAPPGVERNWRTDELPKHSDPEFALDNMVMVFRTEKKHTKEHKARFEALLRSPGMATLLISYDAFMTKEGKESVKRFLLRRRCLYVLDEAHNIKSPSAKRTKTIVASGKYAPYRRVLTGTPMAVGPFDLYSQIKFLDEDFWRDRGIGGAVEFRQYFGRWFTRADCQQLNGYDPGYDKLIEYRNLERLSEWLALISDRVEKSEVLDLPPKLYSKRYHAMTREQQAIYDELRNEFMYQFSDGEIVDGELAIVRLLRFQQVLCNYVPTDGSPKRQIAAKNPRLQLMEEIRDETHRPAIVWARFTSDVDQIMDLLGDSAVRYDGSVTADEAERSKEAFQAGDAKWFVGTAQKGGPGLTLTQAKSVIYYSNSFKLIDRLQSEDRAHRAGMDEHPVNIIDLICEGTVDERIVQSLRDKREISAQVLGDEIRQWL